MNRPPFETFKKAYCKGSYALGSACGHCERCAWEREQLRAKPVGYDGNKWPQTMDAQVWAREWLVAFHKRPEIATDEGTMIGWFSNAISAGYGEATRRAEGERQPSRPKIVCLCGSTRFYQAFQKANYEETMAGRIVLSVGFYPHAAKEMHGEGVGATSEQKEALDALHFRKIELADEVLVLNVGGYVGDSTRREVRHSYALDKPVRWLEPEKVPEDLLRSTEELASTSFATVEEAKAWSQTNGGAEFKPVHGHVRYRYRGDQCELRRMEGTWIEIDSPGYEPPFEPYRPELPRIVNEPTERPVITSEGTSPSGVLPFAPKLEAKDEVPKAVRNLSALIGGSHNASGGICNVDLDDFARAIHDWVVETVEPEARPIRGEVARMIAKALEPRIVRRDELNEILDERIARALNRARIEGRAAVDGGWTTLPERIVLGDGK